LGIEEGKILVRRRYHITNKFEINLCRIKENPQQ